MPKRKGLSYKEKMIKALNKLPNPIIDTKHRIFIYLEDDRARSNESRFEHIVTPRHDLTPRDIKRIKTHMKHSILKKDNERTETYNLSIPRNNYNVEYIKISLEIDYGRTNIAKVKSIFISKNYK